MRLERAVLYIIALSMPISIAAANVGLGLGLILVLRRKFKGLLNQPNLTLLIILLAYLIIDFSAIFLSGYPRYIGKWLEDKWVLSALVIPLVLIRDVRTGERGLYLIMLGGAAVGVLAILQNAVGWDPIRGQFLEYHKGGNMAIGTFNHHLTYGGVALIVALIALARFPFTGDRIDILRGLFYIVLTAVGLYTSFARSALVGFAAGALTLVVLAPHKWRRRALGSVIAGGVLLLILVPGMATRLLYIFQGGAVGEGPRLRLWLSALNIIKHNLWFGVGQGNWKEAFLTYGVPGKYLSLAHPHCDLLSVAVDSGIFALALFCIFWGYVIISLNRTLQNLKVINCNIYTGTVLENPKTLYNIEIVLKSALAVTIGILFAGLFQNYQTDAEVANLLWFSVGTAFSVNAILKREVN